MKGYLQWWRQIMNPFSKVSYFKILPIAQNIDNVIMTSSTNFEKKIVEFWIVFGLTLANFDYLWLIVGAYFPAFSLFWDNERIF